MSLPLPIIVSNFEKYDTVENRDIGLMVITQVLCQAEPGWPAEEQEGEGGWVEEGRGEDQDERVGLQHWYLNMSKASLKNEMKTI